MTNSIQFSQEQAAANLRAQRQLADLLPLLDKAERCGIDVSGYRAIALGLQEQLRAIQAEFMGGQQIMQ